METIFIENSGVKLTLHVNKPLSIGDEVIYRGENNNTSKLLITARRYEQNSPSDKTYRCTLIAKLVD